MKKKVCAYLHTHWDREWYRDKEDFNIRLLEVFDIVLDELKNNNAPFFYMDGQIVALLDYLKYRKNRLQEVLYFIKNNKLAIGPYFVSADSYLVNFRFMLKNLELGLKYSNDFGQKEFIGYMSDIFGISKSSFDALKLKNIDKALIWRGINPKKINNNCDFLYQNIKTTWLAQGYFNDFFHWDEINIEKIENYINKISKYSKNSILLPIGADHLGMLKNANQKIEEVNKKLKNYEIILTSPFEYFKNTEYKNNVKIKEFLDNSDTYILPGVYSARINQKVKNTEIQNKLSRIIEPLDYYLGKKYSENIDFAYKTLIKNHAHDGIYGCSLDSVKRAVDARFEKCENIINALHKRLAGDFKKKYKINGNSSNKIGLLNLSNYDNITVLKLKLPYIIPNSQILNVEKGFCDEILYDIYKIPVTEDIQNLYTQIIEVSKNNKFEFNTVKIKKPSKKTEISSKSIENPYIKLEIKRNKIYVINKKNDDLIELKLTDIKDNGDSYNFAPCSKYKTYELIKSKIIYEGEIESCLGLYFKDIEIKVYLNNHQKFLKFKANINNKTKNHKTQLVCLLNENIKKTTAQDAVGIIERKIDYNYKMQDFMPVKRPFELKTNSYPMQNFVSVDKFSILTKGLHEYEIYKNELRICLLRAFSTISNPKNPARAIPAGPDLKTFESQLLGKIKLEFAILFDDYKKAFNKLDEFFENYMVIDGAYKNDINIKFDKVSQNYYIYGISEDKKIGYNIITNEVELI